MATRAAKLAANVSSGDTTAVLYAGGRTALVLIASAYGSTVKLQMLANDSSTYIDINGTTYSANQITIYDLPEGYYRMHITGGTTTALYADLVSIPYY